MPDTMYGLSAQKFIPKVKTIQPIIALLGI